MVYLDNAATTQVSDEVLHSAINVMCDNYGNPSSLHTVGKSAAKAIKNARSQIAKYIGASTDEIIFTSGGSESDNLALRGIAPYLKRCGKNIITSKIEHHAVLRTCKSLEEVGVHVIYVPVGTDGIVDMKKLEYEMEINRDSLGLVSIMSVNNEIGSIQPIDDIGRLCRKYKAVFMTDAVQALGHIPINVNTSNIDILTISGHKVHAMKGIGALYVRKGVHLSPLITGGYQERQLRAGTENVPGIVSLGKAIELLDNTTLHYKNLRTLLLHDLETQDVKYAVNAQGGVPNIISLTLPKCDSEAMMLLLNMKGVCVSAGSACTASTIGPSHVLKAIGLSDEDANCTIRISMSKYTTTEDIAYASKAICESVKQLHTINHP